MTLNATDTWWLDVTALPDLFWARLRRFADGTAEVLDLDGRRIVFDTEEGALNHLLEDEYERFDLIDETDLSEAGLERAELVPPEGDYPEIVAMMVVRSATTR